MKEKEENKFELFKKGCLGTCWYGKYHYMEPWIGCSHDCPYCYARFRKNVNYKLKEIKTTFTKPKLFMDERDLLNEIKKVSFSGKINILKLSRFTDFFIPEFIRNGLVLEILNILVKSKIKRIIITTKGIGDDKIANIIRKNKEKFSYNVAVRPENEINFNENLLPIYERIDYAAKINSYGVLTTVHMDPFIPYFDDGLCLNKMLSYIKKTGLNRIMFSYLLVSEEILEMIEKKLEPKVFKKLKDMYDLDKKKKYLPEQEDTYYFSIKDEIKRESIEKVAQILNSMNFEFVLCSLKSVKGLNKNIIKEFNICDGKFYA